MQHRLVVRATSESKVALLCDCRITPLYLGPHNVGIEFQALIDAAVRHMDESPAASLILP